MRSRIRILVFCFFCIWGLVLFRLAYVQVIPNSKLSQSQARLYERNITLEPRRGDILDRHGRELAASVTKYQIFADPSLIEKPRSLSRKLAKELRMSRRTLVKKLSRKGTRFVPLRRGLTKEQKQKIQSIGERGLGFLEESQRIYPNETLLSQTLGFVGRDGKGLEGIEGYYDAQLAGHPIQAMIPRDARGRPLLGENSFMLERPEGKSLELTIDREIQYKLEQELATVVKKFEAENAVGIVLDAQTSEVLAISASPTYNSNRALQSSSKLRRNGVINDAFEPGSTLKTFTIAAALEKGVVAPNTKYFCENGEMLIGRRKISEADSKHKFKWLTVSEILAKSSNIGTTKIAFDLGDKALRTYLKKFGFGQKTGIDFWGESTGILPKTPWRKLHLSNVSFGHGVSATAIQVANAYAAIANGGVLYRPYLVKSLINHKTGEVQRSEPHSLGRVMSESVASRLRLMLTSATGAEGTGGNARVPGFIVAGKTGTAQKVDPEGRGYLKGKYISSFAGFAPSSDPQFVIYIAVDSPKKRYYGSEVAAPVFSKVASFILRDRGISPNLMSKNQLIAKVKPESEVVENNLEAISLKKVPNLKGLTVKEVMQKLHGANVNFKVLGDGTVKSVIPKEGSPLTDDPSIVLILDNDK